MCTHVLLTLLIIYVTCIYFHKYMSGNVILQICYYNNKVSVCIAHLSWLTILWMCILLNLCLCIPAPDRRNLSWVRVQVTVIWLNRNSECGAGACIFKITPILFNTHMHIHTHAIAQVLTHRHAFARPEVVKVQTHAHAHTHTHTRTWWSR